MPSEKPRIAERPILVPPRIWEELDSYEKNLQAKLIRALRSVSMDLTHPSLRVEIIPQGQRSFYQVRVDSAHRIHFELLENCYVILAIGPHRLQGIG